MHTVLKCATIAGVAVCVAIGAPEASAAPNSPLTETVTLTCGTGGVDPVGVLTVL